MKQLKNAEQTSRKKHGQQLAEKLAKRQRQVSMMGVQQGRYDCQDASAECSTFVCAGLYDRLIGAGAGVRTRTHHLPLPHSYLVASGQDILWASLSEGEPAKFKRNLRPYVPDEGLLEALMRGIGVHHSSLPKEYRQQVESLFRARVLQVQNFESAKHALKYGSCPVIVAPA
eukprot:1150973-Pelagomonas_calceolata.AAC.10